MNRINRVFASMLALALCAGLLAGCAQEEEKLTVPVCAGGDISTLDPAYMENDSDATIVASLYEGLMRMSCDVSGDTVVTEGIAKSVQVEENFDGTETYTFRLRNAKWSDGRDVTASDFVYAWQRLVIPAYESPNAEILSIVQGYEAVRAGGDISEFAVTAKNATTLIVTLSGKYDWFLTDVCTSPVTSPLRQDVVQALRAQADEDAVAAGLEAGALKWWYDPTRLVTNGPYQAASYAPGEELELIAAPSYYGRVANDGLRMVFTESEEEADRKSVV